MQETAPFETQTPVDQPARVIKLIQGTLNLSPHFQPGADTARARGGFSASGAHVIHAKVPEL